MVEWNKSGYIMGRFSVCMPWCFISNIILIEYSLQQVLSLKLTFWNTKGIERYNNLVCLTCYNTNITRTVRKVGSVSVSRGYEYKMVTYKLSYKFCMFWVPKFFTDDHKSKRMGAVLTFFSSTIQKVMISLVMYSDLGVVCQHRDKISVVEGRGHNSLQQSL